MVVPDTRQRVWIFCFEYAGIAKVGGLGEVCANQTENLVNEPDFDISVFMPSHGRHLDTQLNIKWESLKDPNGKKVILKGYFDPAYFGVKYGDAHMGASFSKFQSFPDNNYFEVEIWKGVLKDVPIHLLVGVNPIAAQILNDRDIYNPLTFNAKMGLFSQVMRTFMHWCIHSNPEFIPAIIHSHDHHPVAAMLCCRQELNLVRKDIRTVISMHLLIWPRREIDFYWKSGVNNEPILLQIGTYRIWRRFKELFEIIQANSIEPPTLEQIGCALADRVIAVSETFMYSDIIPHCGGDIIRWKSDFAWNGCDWDFYQNLTQVINRFQNHLSNYSVHSITSWQLRQLFLTEILGKFAPGEPKFSSENVRAVVSEEFHQNPYHTDCSMDPFEEDGPLVLITGRVTPQKGIEQIFTVMPYLVEKIPDIRIVFCMIPTPYTLEDLRNYMRFARQYPKNVRFIFGVAGSIYTLAYLAADVYCCPSRWEPFGIVALEAMASKVPVVATYVGGLKESILHLEDNPEVGTGLLCPNDDSEALKYGLVSLLTTMKIAELNSKSPKQAKSIVPTLFSQIAHPVLRKQVAKDWNFGQKIRNNAYHRVETFFRWKTVSQKIKLLYLHLLTWPPTY